ncbi:DUF2577 domain-containing protein [Clostridium rectalis]|uniref:DUF2577 domain-containing protein n=1 Tax=Clostridium rectalis TaxID=2040295 RepID=UPI000F634935|nr:DUF2577 domain-containing protein [Clostridium rectalis]
MQDPFVELVNLMKVKGAAYNPPSIQIGKVLSDKPLVVEVGKLQLTKDNFIIAEHLIKNYKRKINIPLCIGEGKAEKYSISEIGIKDGEIIFKNSLEKNDKIAIIPTEDRQTYIILAKVVSL